MKKSEEEKSQIAKNSKKKIKNEMKAAIIKIIEISAIVIEINPTLGPPSAGRAPEI